jgi:hypothetical protein
MMQISSVEYDLTNEARPDYLYSRLRTVAITPGLLDSVLVDIRKAYLESRIARLLVEIEIAHSLTEDETFEFVNGLLQSMSGMRIALVARDSRQRPALAVAQGIALGTGRDLRAFDNLAAGEKWLLED